MPKLWKDGHLEPYYARRVVNEVRVYVCACACVCVRVLGGGWEMQR